MEKILIIGGVAAGATAAAKARRVSADAEITILEAGPDISFANCGLPYFIGGDIKNRSKLILQSPESFYHQYRVTVEINTLATAIDREQKIVTTRNSETGEEKKFAYTKLILAQGGKPITPPIPGADSAHVFQLWTLADMDRIAAFLDQQKPQKAVVVGGGFIGLEMVEALRKRGLEVAVVELMPQVMSLMDAEIAGYIEEEMLSRGVQILTGKGVTEITKTQVKLNDGSVVDADLVLLSIGVRPTLKLAQESGLAIGEAGGLLVNNLLQSSDENIFAAGDMIELEHRIHGKKVRIPLAGPANRQGRIAAENALGGKHLYAGASGTSIVRVFDAVAGITGLSLKAAKAAGYDAEAIVVHKEHHTAYYPGAKQVTVMLVYDRGTGIILGGQTAGFAGAERRLDVIAVAAATKLKISDLAEVDLAYSPPLGTANDVINMACFVAENRISGFSPAVCAAELDGYLDQKKVIWLDVRDSFAFEKGAVEGAINIPLEILTSRMQKLPKDKTILVYDENGKKGHQALRILLGAGWQNVLNLSGGWVSVSRLARAVKTINFSVRQAEIVLKSAAESGTEVADHQETPDQKSPTALAQNSNTPLVVDVRTPEECLSGMYPGAINIPLDQLDKHLDNLGQKDRKIVLYCASGGRSAYAVQMLKQAGFSNLENGGGLMQMMLRQQIR